MDDRSYIYNAQISYDLYPNDYVDPALLTAHSDFSAVAAHNASTLDNHHLPPINQTHSHYEANPSQTDLPSSYQSLNHDLSALNSLSSPVNGHTPLRRYPQTLSAVRSESLGDDNLEFDAFCNPEVFEEPGPADTSSLRHDTDNPPMPSPAIQYPIQDQGYSLNPIHVTRTRQPVLEAYYQDEMYPTMEAKESLAKLVNRPVSYVTHWFNNRRARQNKTTHSSIATIESESSFLSTPATQLSPGRRGKRKTSNALLPPGARVDLLILYPDNSQLEQWPCTFCFKNLKRKEWKRHMNSHISPSWFCMPSGRSLADNMCVFCGSVANGNGQNTDVATCDHFNMDACQNSNLDSLAFPSKDKLRQHIRAVHLRTQKRGTKTRGHDNPDSDYEISIPNSWYIPQQPPESALWCGICVLSLPDWQTTLDHIANHFKFRDRLSTGWKVWPGDVENDELATLGSETS